MTSWTRTWHTSRSRVCQRSRYYILTPSVIYNWKGQWENCIYFFYTITETFTNTCSYFRWLVINRQHSGADFLVATKVQHTGPKLASQQNSIVLYLEEITYLTEEIWLSEKIIYVVVCDRVSLWNVFRSKWTVETENVRKDITNVSVTQAVVSHSMCSIHAV